MSELCICGVFQLLLSAGDSKDCPQALMLKDVNLAIISFQSGSALEGIDKDRQENKRHKPFFFRSQQQTWVEEDTVKHTQSTRSVRKATVELSFNLSVRRDRVIQIWKQVDTSDGLPTG